MKGRVIFWLIVFLPALFPGQVPYQPATFKFRGASYFIYPLRATDINGIPPTAFDLPDGDYVIFTEYEFRGNPLSEKAKLRDTTKVSGIFSIKNKLPEGPATFFLYEYKDAVYGGRTSNKLSGVTNGNFQNGLKEGKWVMDHYQYKTKTIRHYRQGLLHGDALDYHATGSLHKREKYCNDRLCDTVFYYYTDGTPRESWDVYDPLVDKSKLPEKNFTDFVLETVYPNFFFDGKQDQVKSFYKSWDYKGKSENNIRLRNGRNPVFDTLFNYLGAKLVIRKLEDVNQQPVHQVDYYYEDWKTKTKITRIFHGNEERSARSWFYDIKAKITDSVISEKFPLEALDPSSWKDTVISYTYTAKSGMSRQHIIPALGYCWEEKGKNLPSRAPVKIDPARKTVVTADTFRYFPSGVYKVRRNELSPLHTQNEENGFPAYKKFSFLPAMKEINPAPWLPESEIIPASGIAPDLCSAFLSKEVAESFYENGRPLSGKIILTNVKDLDRNGEKNVNIYYTNRIYLSLLSTHLKNGIKDGPLEMVYVTRKKKILSNPEETFRLRPKIGEYYTVANYAAGKLEGPFRTTGNALITQKFPNSDSSSYKIKTRVVSYISLETNYSNGLLNGLYRTRYPGGNIKFSVNMKRGKMDGPAEVFSPQGTTLALVNFRNDSLHGEYAEFSAGIKIREGYFEHNALHGDFILRSEKNIPFLKISAEKNVLQKKTLYFDNGKLREELLFLPGSGTEFALHMLGSESYLENKKMRTDPLSSGMKAHLKSYFENGNLLCEGKIENGKPAGMWKFYNISGVLIDEVVFSDTIILFPNNKGIKRYQGKITGYFNNGKQRFTGFVSAWESGYDCETRQDKTHFTITYTNSWTYEGEQVMKNGNGKGIIYDENGSKIAEGELQDFREEGIWKYYDRSHRLNETGKYVRGEKEGLWFSGDLENVNFTDEKCFDPEHPESQKLIDYNRKRIKVATELYKNGVLMDAQSFETNLNKTVD